MTCGKALSFRPVNSFGKMAADLENKLHDYQCYFNEHRCHSSRNGAPPADKMDSKIIDIKDYRWGKHSRGLFDLPAAA